jgi:hypothetical protein
MDPFTLALIFLGWIFLNVGVALWLSVIKRNQR